MNKKILHRSPQIVWNKVSVSVIRRVSSSVAGMDLSLPYLPPPPSLMAINSGGCDLSARKSLRWKVVLLQRCCPISFGLSSQSQLPSSSFPFTAGSYATASYTTSFTVCCRYLHFIFACGERKCKLIYYAQATECSRQARGEVRDSWQERRLLLPYWHTIKKANEKNEQKDEEAAAEE